MSATTAALVATFTAPSRAIAWASAIRHSQQSGTGVRIGVHTGECAVTGDEVCGLAVEIAAKAAKLAAPGEVLVTGTVKDLVAGSNLIFAEHGAHRLPEVPGEWPPLFSVP